MKFFYSDPLKDFKGKKIKRSFKENIEPQEIFLDQLAQKQEEETGVISRKLEVPISKKILRLFSLVVFILISILFGKTIQLQYFQGEKFSLLAEANKHRTYGIHSERGVVYDRFMTQMVLNEPSFDLVFDKRDFPWDEKDISQDLKDISVMVREDFEDLKKKIQENDFPRILVSENLDHDELILLETRIKDLPGFEIEKNTVRSYKDGEYFSHLLGYTGKINKEEIKLTEEYSITDYIGKTGLEKQYEKILRGEPGKLVVEKDALGNLKSEQVISSPQGGQSLVLWLDNELQKKIITEIKKTLDNTGSSKAAVVALDPQTGGVLALVSFPGFNNNLFAQGISEVDFAALNNDPNEPFLNRAISGRYPTGSTIKPLMAAAGLEEEIITARTKIDCRGFIEIEHKYDPDIVYFYRDWKIHGITDVYKALAESCNVFFYIIGGGYKNFDGLGLEKIRQYLQLFGWGEKNNIDLPGENKGLIPDADWKKENKKESWYIGDTYYLSIGQGDMVASPLQVASAFVSIANEGILYRPKVVKAIIDSQKNVIEEFKPEIVRRDFISSNNLEIVREGMRQGVIYGSSVSLNSLPVKAAAKTGTAQYSKPGHYHNWVTVFAPYENPQIVLTVVIEGVEGTQVAALPVAKGTLEWYFNR